MSSSVQLIEKGWFNCSPSRMKLRPGLNGFSIPTLGASSKAVRVSQSSSGSAKGAKFHSENVQNITENAFSSSEAKRPQLKFGFVELWLPRAANSARNLRLRWRGNGSQAFQASSGLTFYIINILYMSLKIIAILFWYKIKMISI